MTPWQIALTVAAAVAAAAALTVLAVLGNNKIGVTRYKFFAAGIERGIKVVQLSDLHGKSFSKDNASIVLKVAAEKPDIILITGDIIHKYDARNVECALSTVSSLSAVAPVLYVSGNHEMRNKGYRFFRKQLAEAGAEVLDDRCAEVAGITFVGLNGASNRNGKIKRIMPEGGYRVVLAHMPQFLKDYAAAGADLVFSGHAHGGQWRIPFTRIGLYAPGQGLFPKYVCGVYSEGKTKMVVSRGLGNSRFPLRLFNRPEIVAAEILKAE